MISLLQQTWLGLSISNSDLLHKELVVYRPDHKFNVYGTKTGGGALNKLYQAMVDILGLNISTFSRLVWYCTVLTPRYIYI